MKKLLNIDFIKGVAIALVNISVLSLALSVWLMTILDPSDEEGFMLALGSFSFFALASYKWMPSKGFLRSLVMPLKFSSVITVFVIVLSEIGFLDFEEDYLFGQFISCYVVIFVGHTFFKEDPIFTGAKELIEKCKENKNKPLVSIWVALALLSSIMLVSYISVSNASDGAYERADEAYEHADEAYNHADEAHSLIDDLGRY